MRQREVQDLYRRLRDFRDSVGTIPSHRHNTVQPEVLEVFNGMLQQVRGTHPDIESALPEYIEQPGYHDLQILASDACRQLKNHFGNKPKWWESNWGCFVILAAVVLATLVFGCLPALLVVNKQFITAAVSGNFDNASSESVRTALAEAGTIGDSFGVVNAIISGLAFALLILSLLYQRIELAQQRKELRLQRIETAGSTRALREQATTAFITTYLNAMNIENQFHEEQIRRHGSDKIESLRAKRNQNARQHEIKEFVQRLRPFAEDHLSAIEPIPHTVIRIFRDSFSALEVVAEMISGDGSVEIRKRNIRTFQKMLRETRETFVEQVDLCEMRPHADLYQQGMIENLRQALAIVESAVESVSIDSSQQHVKAMKDLFVQARESLEALPQASQA